jgi:hypothetical protein
VQEVNAVTLAVEKLHPDVHHGSVIELGGQDAKIIIFNAKIIIFKVNEETGDRPPITSMNDKCASGTGATIDKCMIKVGLPEAETAKLHFDDAKLHHVAAKCGVFAETDIVNLVKSGHPLGRDPLLARRRHRAAEPVGAHARQHAAAQACCCSGGPNTYLPFPAGVLAQAHPRDVGASAATTIRRTFPSRSWSSCPKRAVLRGLRRGACTACTSRRTVGVYTGLSTAARLHENGRKARLGETARARRWSKRGPRDRRLQEQLYAHPEVRRGGSSPGRSCAA